MDLLRNFLSYSKKSLSSVLFHPINLKYQNIDFFKSPGGSVRSLFFYVLFPIIILFFISTSGCIKNDCDDCYTPPEDFRMKIVDKDTGENLLDGKTYFPDSIEIYYPKNEQKKNVFIQIIETNAHENIVESTNIAWISVGGESKTFFIQLNSEDTDTLYLNVFEYLYYCCRSFPYESVLINGVEMENPYPGMYLLKK